jgi:hypothetical protein
MVKEFSSDSLFVFNNRGAFLKGSWELSKDGQIIKTVTNNDPLRFLIIEVDFEGNLHLNINGFSNIRKIYNGYQVDYLELELEEYTFVL